MSDSDIQFYARWKDSIIEKLIVSHCYKAEHETNPELAINDLISWEVNVALDPAVSEQAQALIDRGAADLAAVTRERDEARATSACGHPRSLVLYSAETGDPLYCELCDTRERRNDAEQMEEVMRTERDALRAEVERLTSAKDGAYEERNRCVALIARMAVAMGYRAGIAKTAIEGWSEDWHGCVYIDLPTGQVSWHYHDTHAHLFEGLPQYAAPWDGHDTPKKYRRVNAAREFRSAEVERLREALSDERIARHALLARECPPDSVVVLVSSMRRLAARAEGGQHDV